MHINFENSILKKMLLKQERSVHHYVRALIKLIVTSTFLIFCSNSKLRLKTPTTQPSLVVWEQKIIAKGTGLEITVNADAIRNPIHASLPMQCSMRETVHCHLEE